MKSTGIKRKNKKNGHNPPAKRQKGDEVQEKWFPGKYVLLHANNSANRSNNIGSKKYIPETSFVEKSDPISISPQEKSEVTEQMQVNGKQELKKKKPKAVHAESQLEKFYEKVSESEDEEWSCEDGAHSSTDRNTSEWSTDTDYSEGDSMEDEYSFRESDCESISDENSSDIIWGAESSDDSDYVPHIEDRYIKSGDAILYEGPGLDLAFGDTMSSKIIDISEIARTLASDEEEDEEIPELIPINPSLDEMFLEPEKNIEDLSIDDKLHCDQLKKCASFYDCKDEQGVILKLNNTIHFHGVIIIKAIANNVQINGYTLKPNELQTSASISRADYYLNLTPVIEKQQLQDNVEESLMKLLPADVAATVMSNFNPKSESIIHLQHGIPDSTLEMLQFYSPHPLLPSKKMILKNSPCLSSELILSAKFFVANENRKISTFQISEQWRNIEMTAESRLLVVGGKNVGKSSLSQYVINRDLGRFEKILLIDLDIGQPICSPAQTISATVITKPILGAGYLSNRQPEKCFLFGDKSITISPFKYIRAAVQLMEFCTTNPSFQSIPWVINTMGYQKGFGTQLICLLIKLLQPSDVVQIQHRFKSYNFPTIFTEKVVNEFEFSFFDSTDLIGISPHAFFVTHVLDSIVNNYEQEADTQWISNASEKRKLSILAQLAKLLKGNQKYLNDVTPFAAPLNKIRILNTDEEFDLRKQEFNMDLLNGSLVYLCHATADVPLTSKSIVECFGIGIIRAADKINQQLYILLPQTENYHNLQAKVNTLAIGNIPLPAEILLKQSYHVASNLPHVTFFKDRTASSNKYINKRKIKDCY